MPAPVTLPGRMVRLEPLSVDMLDELTAAASEDRATYTFTRVPRDRTEVGTYVAAALDEQYTGRTLPFAVRWLAQDRIVGASRFLRLGYWHGPLPWPPGSLGPVGDIPDVADIGYTWLAASAQRKGLNTEAKLLMLTHAFETWNVHRVAFSTDTRNTRSRQSLEHLGACFEGVRRADCRGADDTVRDTAHYSILRCEWAQVRRHLHERLARHVMTSMA